MTQAQVEGVTRHRLLDDVGVPLELIANGGADEVGPVGVEPFADHQIDLSQIDVA